MSDEVKVIDVTGLLNKAESLREIVKNASDVAAPAPVSAESPVYSKRELPTAGLGTDVRGITHIDAALTKANLNYKIGQDPVYRKMPDGTFRVIMNGSRVLNFREDTLEDIEVVSKRYHPFQNSQAFNFLEGMLASGALQIETAGQFDYGSVWIEARTPKNLTVLGDQFLPYALIKNSHDGTSGVKVCFTFTRVVCRNTLAMAVNGAPRVWQAKHLGTIEDRMKEAANMLEVYGAYTEEYPVMAEKLAGTNLSEDDIVRVVQKMFPLKKDAGMKMINHAAKQAKEILSIYNGTPDLKKFKGTAWCFLNAIGDWATHGTVKETTGWKESRLNRLADGHPQFEIAQRELLAIKA
jgi:phage/plasmid-like protein (TIGR03299 family)